MEVRQIHGEYTTGEVCTLIEEHEELRARAETWGFRLRILLCLADVARVVPRLTRVQRQAIFLMGTHYFSAAEAGRVLGVGEERALARYEHAILRTTKLLNGRN